MIVVLAILGGCKEEEQVKPDEKEDIEEDIEEGIEEIELFPISFLEIPISNNSVINSSQLFVPEIHFTYPIGSEIVVTTDSSEVKYKLELDTVYISSSYNIELEKEVWNISHDTLSILYSTTLSNSAVDINIELSTLMLIDGEWVYVNYSHLQENYTKTVRHYIKDISTDWNWIKTDRFDNGSEVSLYSPLFFDLSFIPYEEFKWVDSIGREVKYEYSLSLELEGDEIEFEERINEKTSELIIFPNHICESCEYNLTFEGKLISLVLGEEVILSDEDGEFTFIGGKQGIPNVLDTNNIEYSYPVDLQYYFLVKEYPKGYLKLYRGQESLLKSETNSSWTKYVRFSNGSYEKMVPLSYSDLYFEYEIPEDLTKDRVFTAEFLEVSDSGEESVFYEFYFRTSFYDTFLEKIADNGPSQTFWRSSIPDTSPLQYRVGNNLYFDKEAFGYEEIKGIPEKRIEPFLVLYNDFDNNEYYQNHIYPYIYEAVEAGTVSLYTYTEYGIPPINAVFWWQYPYKIQLSENQIANGWANPLPYSFSGTVSNMSHMYFVNHQIEIGAESLASPSVGGNFPYYIEYRLPGDKHVSKYYHSN